MNFKTNLNKNTLIGNEIIKIYFENKTVEFVPPNLRKYIMDLDFLETYYVLKQNPDDFNKNINTGMKIETRYGILRYFLYTKFREEWFGYFIGSLFPNIEILDDKLLCNNSEITSEEYEILFDFIAVSCAEISYEDFIKKIDNSSSKIKDLTEDEKKQKEVQERLEKAKNKKNKKDTNKSNGNKITIDQIVIAILYEFSNLSIEDVYNMNMFTLLEFWSYIGKIIDNQIQIVAAGNGNLKEFTYFIH